ncbi:MAG: class I SAM-dependent methyltransferase [Actinomycetota bacterium]
MFPQPPSEDYYEGFNEYLFRGVPRDAKRILEVGCSNGRLASELKQQDPERYIAGVELDRAAAEIARSRIDDVFVLDIERELPPIEPGSLDCVLFGDVLEHLVNPEAVLVAVRRLLSDKGIVLISVPNIGHFTIIRELLRADFMYQPAGLLDSTHLRFFTHATVTKMMLDAGFLPSVESIVPAPITDEDVRAARPLLDRFAVDPGHAKKYLDAYEYIFKGELLPVAEAASRPVTFVAAVNDEQQLRSNLMRSPCFAPGTPHELLLIRSSASAADAFNEEIGSAKNELVVFVQQGMYLPRGWDAFFTRGFEEAEAQFAPVGVIGAFGTRGRDGEVEQVGRIVDRDKLTDTPVPLPAEVGSVDEMVLAVRRTTPLRFDPSLGFHLYGADLCLAANALGLRNVVVEAPCFRNSPFAFPSAAFHRARELLVAKWPDARPLWSGAGRLDTMRTEPAPSTWLEEQKATLNEHLRERDALRRQLNTAQDRVKRMEASAFWKARNVARTIVRRGGFGRAKNSEGTKEKRP